MMSLANAVRARDLDDARVKNISRRLALAVARGGRARAPVDAMDLGRGRGADLGFLGGGRARGRTSARGRWGRARCGNVSVMGVIVLTQKR